MLTDEKSLIAEITEVFKEYEDQILESWLNLIRHNITISSDVEFEIFQEGFKSMLHDFITYLPKGDIEGYFASNKLIAKGIAYNDLSYRKFIKAFHLFEDSYSDILFNRYKNIELARYLSILDKLHHTTIAIVTEIFFSVRDSTVEALVNLAELRDDTTGNHLNRTKKYLMTLAEGMNLDEDYMQSLYKAGPLHDIGKVGIRDSILLKPGKLTSDEFEEIKRHTILGAQAIEKIYTGQPVKTGYLLIAKDIALYHHEKFDGTGYPENLKGLQIPLSARIFALIDAYDAIVSKRPYKEPLSHEEAVDRIKRDSGKHFDPEIVNAFIKGK